MLILIFIAIVVYGSVLLQILIERTNYSILEKKYENELLDTNFSFGSHDGFIVAAGITEYPLSESSGIEDPEIGELKYFIKSWDSNEN